MHKNALFVRHIHVLLFHKHHVRLTLVTRQPNLMSCDRPPINTYAGARVWGCVRSGLLVCRVQGRCYDNYSVVNNEGQWSVCIVKRKYSCMVCSLSPSLHTHTHSPMTENSKQGIEYNISQVLSVGQPGGLGLAFNN